MMPSGNRTEGAADEVWAPKLAWGRLVAQGFQAAAPKPFGYRRVPHPIFRSANVVGKATRPQTSLPTLVTRIQPSRVCAVNDTNLQAD